MLVRAIYVSSRAPGVGPFDVRRIVSQSQIRNRQLDVTGVLAMTADSFAQVLEGDSPAIDLLLQKMYGDHRHYGMTVLAYETVRSRLFERWVLQVLEADEVRETLELARSNRLLPDRLAVELLNQVTQRRARGSFGSAEYLPDD